MDSHKVLAEAKHKGMGEVEAYKYFLAECAAARMSLKAPTMLPAGGATMIHPYRHAGS